jgi:hypothetical protein
MAPAQHEENARRTRQANQVSRGNALDVPYHVRECFPRLRVDRHVYSDKPLSWKHTLVSLSMAILLARVPMHLIPRYHPQLRMSLSISLWFGELTQIPGLI